MWSEWYATGEYYKIAFTFSLILFKKKKEGLLKHQTVCLSVCSSVCVSLINNIWIKWQTFVKLSKEIMPLNVTSTP
jgi:hypothetical protein